MSIRSHLTISALALALALGQGAPVFAAQDPHKHDQAAPAQLTLNKGAKWQGDANMIKGMDGIRAAFAPKIKAIHANTLPAQDYAALAKGVQAEVDFMVANCKLEPAVDAQLHVVLEQVLDGVNAMQSGKQPRAGAVRIVQALGLYGKHFEHPGWRPLE